MIGGSLTLTSDFGVLISTFESHIWIRNVQVREAPEILLLNGHQSLKKEKKFPHQPFTILKTHLCSLMLCVVVLGQS